MTTDLAQTISLQSKIGLAPEGVVPFLLILSFCAFAWVHKAHYLEKCLLALSLGILVSGSQFASDLARCINELTGPMLVFCVVVHAIRSLDAGEVTQKLPESVSTESKLI